MIKNLVRIQEMKLVLETQIFRYLILWTCRRFVDTKKDTLKAFNNFKNKQHKCMKNVFWYGTVCIFWNCIQQTIHWDETQILKKVPSDKINSTDVPSFFFFASSKIYHIFTFNLRLLYELNHRIRLCKTVCGIFYFRFHLIFIKVYIFV